MVAVICQRPELLKELYQRYPNVKVVKMKMRLLRTVQFSLVASASFRRKGSLLEFVLCSPEKTYDG